MNGLYYFLCSLISLCSNLHSNNSQQREGLKFTVNAVDLSENMHQLSSGNDELLIFIYQFKTDSTLTEPLYFKEFTFSKNHQSKDFQTGINTTREQSLLFILLERDTQRPVEQIEPVIRIHFGAILDSYRQLDYNRIESYLSDEDLLGIKKIDLRKGLAKEIRLAGRLKMDKYDYTIEIQN